MNRLSLATLNFTAPAPSTLDESFRFRLVFQNKILNTLHIYFKVHNDEHYYYYYIFF